MRPDAELEAREAETSTDSALEEKQSTGNDQHFRKREPDEDRRRIYSPRSGAGSRHRRGHRRRLRPSSSSSLRHASSRDTTASRGWVVTRSSSVLNKNSSHLRASDGISTASHNRHDGHATTVDPSLDAPPTLRRNVSDLSRDSAVSDKSSSSVFNTSWSEGSTVDKDGRASSKEKQLIRRKDRYETTTERSKRQQQRRNHNRSPTRKSSSAAVRGDSSNEQTQLEEQRLEYLKQREAIRQQQYLMQQERYEQARAAAAEYEEETKRRSDCGTDSTSSVSSSPWSYWTALHSQLTQEFQEYQDFMASQCKACLDDAALDEDDEYSSVLGFLESSEAGDERSRGELHKTFSTSSKKQENGGRYDDDNLDTLTTYTRTGPDDESNVFSDLESKGPKVKKSSSKKLSKSKSAAEKKKKAKAAKKKKRQQVKPLQ